MMSILETRHLRLVCALADEGGPTRAAARLHLSQSAVSHQLAELESRLGVALFSRVRRRLVLTRAGERLVEAARSTLAELARVEQALHRTGDQARVPMRLSTECFTGYHWLPAILPALRRDHPHVDVRIVLGATQKPIAALLAGQIDLALVSSEVRDRQLVVEPLFLDEWVVVLPPGHPLAARSHVRAVDLGGAPLFVHEGTPRDVKRLRERVVAEGARMPRLEVLPLTEAILELVRADLGIALMSRWAVGSYEGRVQVRRFTKAGLKERWSAVYRRDARDRLPLADVAALLRARPPEAGPTARAAARR